MRPQQSVVLEGLLLARLSVALLLLLAAAMKLWSSVVGGVAESAADLMFGPAWATRIGVCVAVLETVVCGLLLMPGSGRVGAASAACLMLGALGYLGVSRTVSPGAACGCFGRGGAPQSWRAFALAFWIMGISIGSVSIRGDWFSVSARSFPLATLVLLIGLLLSPLAGALWGRDVSAPQRGVPFDLLLERVVKSRRFAAIRSLIADPRPVESLDVARWRLFVFAGVLNDTGVLVVFGSLKRRIVLRGPRAVVLHSRTLQVIKDYGAARLLGGIDRDGSEATVQQSEQDSVHQFARAET